jgi:hypothetical protein
VDTANATWLKRGFRSNFIRTRVTTSKRESVKIPALLFSLILQRKERQRRIMESIRAGRRFESRYDWQSIKDFADPLPERGH